MNAYQSLYRQLFALVMANQHTLEDGLLSPEARAIHEQMNRMPPHGKRGDEQKGEWGRAVGEELYRREIYGT